MGTIEIGSKVKHLPSGNIIKITSLTKVFLKGTIIDARYPDWFSSETTKVRISECQGYIEPPKEKSPYEIYRERVKEKAKSLPSLPSEVSQEILWLKSAIIEKVENIDKIEDDKIYTFRKGLVTDDNSKFGFSEHYVNLLMQMAYDAGHKRATDDLERRHKASSDAMKVALDSIKDALDNAGWIEYTDYDN